MRNSRTVSFATRALALVLTFAGCGQQAVPSVKAPAAKQTAANDLSNPIAKPVLEVANVGHTSSDPSSTQGNSDDAIAAVADPKSIAVPLKPITHEQERALYRQEGFVDALPKNV